MLDFTCPVGFVKRLTLSAEVRIILMVLAYLAIQGILFLMVTVSFLIFIASKLKIPIVHLFRIRNVFFVEVDTIFKAGRAL